MYGKKKLPVLGVCKEFERKVCRIVQIGIAPFGLSLSPMISLLFMNRFCLSYGGKLRLRAMPASLMD